MSQLQKRRELARMKKQGRGAKTFNMHWIVETMDQVITELSEYAGREPEIDAAIETALALKQLVSAYSQRTTNTAYQSLKGSNSLNVRDWSQSVLNAMIVNISRAKDIVDSAETTIDQLDKNSEEYYHDGILSDDALDLSEELVESYDGLVDAIQNFGDRINSERGVLGGMDSDELIAIMEGKAFRMRSRRGRASRKFFRQER